MTPDEYLFDAEGKLLGKNISKKLWMYERNEYTGVTSKVYVPVSKMNSQVLSEVEMNKLVELAGRIAGTGGEQHIIDWTIGRNRVVITDAKPEKYEIEKREEENVEGDAVVTGKLVSRGVAKGKVKRVDHFSGIPDRGSVVVMETSDAGILAVSADVAAVVADEGGRLCNMGVLSRELAIPALSAAHNARSLLKDGDGVKIIADIGKVFSTKIVEVEAKAVEPAGAESDQSFHVFPKEGSGESVVGGEKETVSVIDDIEKVLIGASAESEPAERPAAVFALSAPGMVGSVQGAEGFIIRNPGDVEFYGSGMDEGRAVSGMPLWVSCAGSKDFQWAAVTAKSLSETAPREVGILVTIVRGRDDVNKLIPVMPPGTKLGVSVKTPAMLLSPELVVTEDVSMVNIDIETLVQLSMGLRRPEKHLHESVLSMIGRMSEACSLRSIPCCATIGMQHLTDRNIESLLEKGVNVICVEPPSVLQTRGIVSRIGKLRLESKNAGVSVEATGADALVESGQKKPDDLIQFDPDPSFS